MCQVLRRLEKVLDYFEEELGHEGRVGCWLGGGQICVADITLGGYHNIIEGSKITCYIRRPVPAPAVSAGPGHSLLPR